MIGEMRERITLQRQITTTDELGGQITTWQDVGTYWAKVEEVKADLRIIAERGEMKRTFKITTWYIPVTKSDRIIYKDMPLKIVAVRIPDSYGQFIEIIAEAEE